MSTRRSLAWSFLDRYAALLINIVSSMAIARLLTPADLGVYSVTAVWLTLLSTVRDFGAGQYLVQARDLDDDAIRSVWAVQLGIGLMLSVLTLAMSLPLASFYGEHRMVALLCILALNYSVNPFGSITYAWLMREMRFGALATIRVSAAAAGAATSTLLAWKGWGPMSLALGGLASTVTTASVAGCFRPSGYPWIPGVRKLREVLGFGSKMTLSSIMNTLAAGRPTSCWASSRAWRPQASIRVPMDWFRCSAA